MERLVDAQIDAEIHHNFRVLKARVGELADKHLGIQPAGADPLLLLQYLDNLLSRKDEL